VEVKVEKWEYWTGFFRAEAESDAVKQYLKQRWPDWDPGKYAPQAMIPQLNEFGQNGWELVHMTPVADVGKNHDVKFVGDLTCWSHSYFCDFKRRT